MFRRLLLIAVTFGFCSASDSWRDNCKALNNWDVAPFLYHSQSDLAVLAFYNSMNFRDFEEGKTVEFDINPICFVKGYSDEPNLQVISGTQRCRITPLGRMLEYPSLFFLRKKPNSDKWILLNSGEFKHIVHNRGILFGLGRAGRNFPQTCGVTRRRTSIDEGNCRSNKCKNYCSYKVAKPGQCIKSSEFLKSTLPTVPTPRPPVEPPRPPPKTKDEKKTEKTKEPEDEKEEKGIDDGPGGGTPRLFQPLLGLIAVLSGLCVLVLR